MKFKEFPADVDNALFNAPPPPLPPPALVPLDALALPDAGSTLSGNMDVRLSGATLSAA